MSPDGEPVLETEDSALAALLALFRCDGSDARVAAPRREEHSCDAHISDADNSAAGGRGRWQWRCLVRGGEEVEWDTVSVFAFSRSSARFGSLGGSS
jgi:hypothetical protein